MSSELRKEMPNRHDNKALSYDRNCPEELLCYIEDVEKDVPESLATKKRRTS